MTLFSKPPICNFSFFCFCSTGEFGQVLTTSFNYIEVEELAN